MGIKGQEGYHGPEGSRGRKGRKGNQGPQGRPGPPGPTVLASSIRQPDDTRQTKARFNYYQSILGDPEKEGVPIQKQLLDLAGQTSQIRKPLGAKDNPARTCRDLYACQPYLDNGYYWIDPNLGCPVDAINVYCDFTGGGKSCIQPSPDKVPRRTWSRGKPNARILFSKVATNFSIQYPISKVQFNFLRLLSTDASQRVSYNCKSSTAWYNTRDQTFKYGVRFQGWSGKRFKYKGKLSPQVLRDGCKFDDDVWRKTDFLLKTTNLEALPIIDFNFFYRGLRQEQFGLDIGPVCFS